MDASIERGLELATKAIQARNKDRLYQVWVVDRHNLKSDFELDFEKWVDAITPKKIDPLEKEKTKARIDKQTEEIMEKFARKEVKE